MGGRQLPGCCQKRFEQGDRNPVPNFQLRDIFGSSLLQGFLLCACCISCYWTRLFLLPRMKLGFRYCHSGSRYYPHPWLETVSHAVGASCRIKLGAGVPKSSPERDMSVKPSALLGYVFKTLAMLAIVANAVYLGWAADFNVVWSQRRP